MPRQFSLQNLFQMLTALAAVSMWVRLQIDTPEFLYPGHWVMLGCSICAWGTLTRYPAWIAVRMLAVGLLLVMVGVVERPLLVGYGFLFDGQDGYESQRRAMNFVWQMLYLPPLAGIAVLPRTFVLLQKIPGKKYYWSLATIVMGWISVVILWRYCHWYIQPAP